MKTFLLAAAAILTLAAPPALAADATRLRIDHPWCRPSPPAAPTGAGYLTITNTGRAPDRLLGGSADFSDRLEIHEMSMAGGVMRMRPVAGGLEIAPGGTVALKPGGFHIMFIGLKSPLKLGDTVPFTLTFARAGAVKVACRVETPPPMDMSSGAMK